MCSIANVEMRMITNDIESKKYNRLATVIILCSGMLFYRHRGDQYIITTTSSCNLIIILLNCDTWFVK